MKSAESFKKRLIELNTKIIRLVVCLQKGRANYVNSYHADLRQCIKAYNKQLDNFINAYGPTNQFKKIRVQFGK